ncbi:hypothetical protein RFI_11601 [Reticulomyxa filosa]|uniref:Uncharacterized protein n=1 Tax=Reticulomyxa filosa TaxID=46433 RepID=X6NI06_RETFI|nr:hypothetical protein RFI_11601 [Reticulomyxa filosa]|eukprot:ETO25538.1 hypothetical protein RFI_11601 [Reticulomyxa filosa]
MGMSILVCNARLQEGGVICQLGDEINLSRLRGDVMQMFVQLNLEVLSLMTTFDEYKQMTIKNVKLQKRHFPTQKTTISFCKEKKERKFEYSVFKKKETTRLTLILF